MAFIFFSLKQNKPKNPFLCFELKIKIKILKSNEISEKIFTHKACSLRLFKYNVQLGRYKKTQKSFLSFFKISLTNPDDSF